MSKEQLLVMRADDLAAMCKERGIVHYKGKSRFTKSEMVDAILNQQKLNSVGVKEEKIESASVVAKEKEAAGNDFAKKEKYLNNIEIGTLVAFREHSGRLNTAMVQNVSFKRKQLRLVTQYNKEFIVAFEDVVWIRTKKRWPAFVLNELKQRGTKNDINR